MWFPILSGIVAFVLWCITDTSLDPNHFRNSKGEITFWGIVSLVLVQIFLWTLAGLFAAWIVPHLPGFFLAGWRLPITLFCSLFLQWFSLLMILQYVWMIVRPTLNTASVAVMAKFGSQWAKEALESGPRRFRLLDLELRRRPVHGHSKEGVDK